MHVNDVYIGNGVSELIVMAMQGLLDDGDEMLVPMPDYPLWTAAVNLSGGKAVHYKCDEENYWYPDLADMESKITAIHVVLSLSIQTTQQVLFIHVMYWSKLLL
jgi:alanine-synthesizing transaminase